jgi:hypothetical protein
MRLARKPSFQAATLHRRRSESFPEARRIRWSVPWHARCHHDGNVL